MAQATIGKFQAKAKTGALTSPNPVLTARSDSTSRPEASGGTNGMSLVPTGVYRVLGVVALQGEMTQGLPFIRPDDLVKEFHSIRYNQPRQTIKLELIL